jgi:hypothetical protein
VTDGVGTGFTVAEDDVTGGDADVEDEIGADVGEVGVVGLNVGS